MPGRVPLGILSHIPRVTTSRESSVLETRTSGMTHAPGRLHSGRDRPGTIRANLVGDFRFRVRSYVIFKRLPIAPLILYFLARQTDWQESLQGTNVRQGCFEFSKRALFFVLCPVTRC